MGARVGNFSLHHRVQNGSGAHPASYPMGTRGSFPGVQRPGREADHSPPSSAEVKNAWSYTSTLQYAFMAWCLVKHRDNFSFTFTFTLYGIYGLCQWTAAVQSVQWLGYAMQNQGSIPGRGWDFIFPATASRPALGFIQPPNQWVPGG
jgi:hypothetical protein